ncbi:hypothetical protein ACRYGW_00880 [Mycobacteroides abscessus]
MTRFDPGVDGSTDRHDRDDVVRPHRTRGVFQVTCLPAGVFGQSTAQLSDRFMPAHRARRGRGMKLVDVAGGDFSGIQRGVQMRCGDAQFGQVLRRIGGLDDNGLNDRLLLRSTHKKVLSTTLSLLCAKQETVQARHAEKTPIKGTELPAGNL